jgi:DNA-binding NarL/FixJ family response regulator
MRILIADDHAVLRRGLIQVIAEALPDVEFGEAADAAGTISRLREGPWHVLILDIFMPGRSGLDVLQHARECHPGLPVLVISSAPDDQMAERVLRTGAAGYLNKQAAPDELVVALRRVMNGRRYVSASTTDRLVQRLGMPAGGAHALLSNREHDVLRLLMAGKTVKDIADALALSPKTVSTYHTRIWEKLGVDNDVDLTRYVIEHRLLGGDVPNA